MQPTTAPIQEPQQQQQPLPEPVPVGQPVDLSKVAADPGVSEVEVKDLPLFAGQAFSEHQPANIAIYRLGPIPEGMLGTMEPTSEVEDIRRRYGGGHYKIEARTARGFVIKNGSKQITVGGEPLFQSDGARAEYLQLVRNRFQQAPTFNPPAQQPAQQQPAPAPAPPPVVQYAPAPVPPAAGDGMATLVAAIVTAQAQAQTNLLTFMMDQANKREDNQLRLFELIRSNSPAPPVDAVTILKEGMKIASRIGGGGKEEQSTIDKMIDGAGKLIPKAVELVNAERKVKEASAAAAAPIQVAPAPQIDRAALEEEVLNALRNRPDVLMLQGELGVVGSRAVARCIELGADPEKVIVLALREVATLSKEQLSGIGVMNEEPPAPPRQPAPAAAPPPPPAPAPAPAPAAA